MHYYQLLHEPIWAPVACDIVANTYTVLWSWQCRGRLRTAVPNSALSSLFLSFSLSRDVSLVRITPLECLPLYPYPCHLLALQSAATANCHSLRGNFFALIIRSATSNSSKWTLRAHQTEGHAKTFVRLLGQSGPTQEVLCLTFAISFRCYQHLLISAVNMSILFVQDI